MENFKNGGYELYSKEALKTLLIDAYSLLESIKYDLFFNRTGLISNVRNINRIEAFLNIFSEDN